MKTFNVTVSLSEVSDNCSPHDIVKVFGASRILSTFTYMEILRHFDNDELLSLMGEQKIRDFLESSRDEKVG